MNAADRNKQLDFMTSPGDWPHWPILPIKRPSRYASAQSESDPNTWSHAIMAAWDDHRFTVFFVNMLALESGTLKEILGPLPQKTYTDFDAILDDDWMVD
jgi:hypothetical protein